MSRFSCLQLRLQDLSNQLQRDSIKPLKNAMDRAAASLTLPDVVDLVRLPQGIEKASGNTCPHSPWMLGWLQQCTPGYWLHVVQPDIYMCLHLCRAPHPWLMFWHSS